MKMKDGMRESFHAKQALFLGIVNLALSIFLIGFLTWIYTIYIGFKAANGEDPEIPYITKMVREIKLIFENLNVRDFFNLCNVLFIL